MRDYIPVATWRWIRSIPKDNCYLLSFKSEWTVWKETANFAKSPTWLNMESFYDMAVMNLWRDFFSFFFFFFCSLWMCRFLCVEDVVMNENMNLYSFFLSFTIKLLLLCHIYYMYNQFTLNILIYCCYIKEIYFNAKIFCFWTQYVDAFISSIVNEWFSTLLTSTICCRLFNKVP